MTSSPGAGWKLVAGDAMALVRADEKLERGVRLRERREDRRADPGGDEERSAVDQAINELLTVYHGDDYLLIRAHIDKLNNATMRLAENMMNSAVSNALKGTKI